ncbi:MAG: hypothetical protein LBC56_06025 [Oscillospiraceae bacterium]|jgi:triacylglycerol lipase|nr:hypothetical protein [Oscillospiraceae bacterium]
MNCGTKYPIVLVHGTGVRDAKRMNYWGRIPAALEQNGARVFYGEQDSWGSVAHNAEVLKENVNRILAETGSEKVNLIAHSKGGLDARYMISSLGMAGKAASLTTIATPHHGSKTMDRLCKLPKGFYKAVSFFIDGFSRAVGDKEPDFFTVVHQFSTEHMKQFNRQNPDAPSVYYQSYTAVMKSPLSDALMWWQNLIIGLVEGENDGLVTVASARWTNFRGVLRGKSRRGISHLDETDLRRMNFSRKANQDELCDIREFYVKLAAELKEMGL